MDRMPWIADQSMEPQRQEHGLRIDSWSIQLIQPHRAGQTGKLDGEQMAGDL